MANTKPTKLKRVMSMWDISEEAANVIYNLSNFGLILAAVLGLVGGIGAFWSSSIREKYVDHKTSQHESLIAQANQAAAQAHTGLALANLELEDRKKENLQLALKLKDEQQERVELMKAVAPRIIGFELSESDNPLNLKKLIACKNTKVILRSIPKDEPVDTAKQLQRVLGTAKWNVQRDVLAEDQFAFSGIQIEVGDTACESQIYKAADLLVEFLEAQNIEANTRTISTEEPIPSDTMRITIGIRPWFYFVDMMRSPDDAKRRREEAAQRKQRQTEDRALTEMFDQVRRKHPELFQQHSAHILRRGPDGIQIIGPDGVQIYPQKDNDDPATDSPMK
jgi:hypothetical protein